MATYVSVARPRRDAKETTLWHPYPHAEPEGRDPYVGRNIQFDLIRKEVTYPGLTLEAQRDALDDLFGPQAVAERRAAR